MDVEPIGDDLHSEVRVCERDALGQHALSGKPATRAARGGTVQYLRWCAATSPTTTSNCRRSRSPAIRIYPAGQPATLSLAIWHHPADKKNLPSNKKQRDLIHRRTGGCCMTRTISKSVPVLVRTRTHVKVQVTALACALAGAPIPDDIFPFSGKIAR
jgi:hypothetical protein